MNGSEYCAPPPRLTPPVFFSMNFTTSSRYVIGSSCAFRNRCAATYGFSGSRLACTLHVLCITLTAGIVRELQGWHTLLDVNVEHIIILFAFV